MGAIKQATIDPCDLPYDTGVKLRAHIIPGTGTDQPGAALPKPGDIVMMFWVLGGRRWSPRTITRVDADCVLMFYSGDNTQEFHSFSDAAIALQQWRWSGDERYTFGRRVWMRDPRQMVAPHNEELPQIWHQITFVTAVTNE